MAALFSFWFMTLFKLIHQYAHLFDFETTSTLDNSQPFKQYIIKQLTHHNQFATHALVALFNDQHTVAIFSQKPILDQSLPVITFNGKSSHLLAWLKFFQDEHEIIIQHGVVIQYQNQGILISGESGSGKTRLAAALLQSGATLICDDAPYIGKQKQRLLAICPPKYVGLMHFRDQGMVDTKQKFNAKAAIQSPLKLVVKLTDNPLTTVENFSLLGINLPCYEVPIFSEETIAIVKTLLRE
jgi:serine kinase of HPr protein (carbohydrate metabolism regulator)